MEADKKNPQSLCDLFREIVETKYARHRDAAEALSKKRNKNRLPRSFKERALGPLLRNEHEIKYSHLEMMANLLGVPAGVLLLYSRLRSHQRDNEPLENKKIMDALEVIARKFRMGTRLDVNELEYWASIFKASAQKKRPNTESVHELDLFRNALDEPGNN